MISQFTVHTNNCVCHKIRSLFKLRGMYNFGSGVEKSEKNSLYNNKWQQSLIIQQIYDQSNLAKEMYAKQYCPNSIWSPFAGPEKVLGEKCKLLDFMAQIILLKINCTFFFTPNYMNCFGSSQMNKLYKFW